MISPILLVTVSISVNKAVNCSLSHTYADHIRYIDKCLYVRTGSLNTSVHIPESHRY